MDHPYRNVSYIGDFNVHNSDWICSTDDKDAGGIQAEEMCEMFGLNQLIDFPTRGENTLGLDMTIHDGVAIDQPGAGTSDHIAIAITLELDSAIPSPPVHKPTFLWQYAPWPHIRGAVKRELATWNPNDCESVDAAEIDLDDKFFSIIKKYVTLSRPKKPGPTIWWDDKCQEAYVAKLKAFTIRFDKPNRYYAAVKHCRTVQNRALAIYQNELREKLQGMHKCDKSFWMLAKEIGGIESQSPDALAEHFATKMSNGKDVEFDYDFEPQDSKCIPISSWKIRRKQVKKCSDLLIHPNLPMEPVRCFGRTLQMSSVMQLQPCSDA